MTIEGSTTHVPRIVVGVDGSPGSRTALAWAMAQARLTGATLQAVGAWLPPVVYEYAYSWPAEVVDDAPLLAFTEKLLADAIAEAQGEGPVVLVESSAARGHPAEVLLNAARDAQLLVVGSRGHGAFAGMLLGSVSQHCVHHATCPVVVVPTRSAAPAG